MGARLSNLNCLKALRPPKPKPSPDEPNGLKTPVRERASASEPGPARSSATGADTVTDKPESTSMSPTGVLAPVEPALGGEGPTSDEARPPVDTAQTSEAVAAQPERRDTIGIEIDPDEEPLTKGPQTEHANTGAQRGATSGKAATRPNQTRQPPTTQQTQATRHPPATQQTQATRQPPTTQQTQATRQPPPPKGRK